MASRNQSPHTLKLVSISEEEIAARKTEIVALLASHFGCTEEEQDYIINYDIKYRMGDRLAEGVE